MTIAAAIDEPSVLDGPSINESLHSLMQEFAFGELRPASLTQRRRSSQRVSAASLGSRQTLFPLGSHLNNRALPRNTGSTPVRHATTRSLSVHGDLPRPCRPSAGWGKLPAHSEWMLGQLSAHGAVTLDFS
jgi:hypothetical protein